MNHIKWWFRKLWDKWPRCCEDLVYKRQHCVPLRLNCTRKKGHIGRHKDKWHGIKWR